MQMEIFKSRRTDFCLFFHFPMSFPTRRSSPLLQVDNGVGIRAYVPTRVIRVFLARERDRETPPRAPPDISNR